MKTEKKSVSFSDEVCLLKDGKWIDYFCIINQNELLLFKNKGNTMKYKIIKKFLESKCPKAMIKFKNAIIQEKNINGKEKNIVISFK